MNPLTAIQFAKNVQLQLHGVGAEEYRTPRGNVSGTKIYKFSLHSSEPNLTFNPPPHNDYYPPFNPYPAQHGDKAFYRALTEGSPWLHQPLWTSFKTNASRFQCFPLDQIIDQMPWEELKKELASEEGATFIFPNFIIYVYSKENKKRINIRGFHGNNSFENLEELVNYLRSISDNLIVKELPHENNLSSQKEFIDCALALAPKIYVKPAHGMQGTGIFTVKNLQNDYYQVATDDTELASGITEHILKKRGSIFSEIRCIISGFTTKLRTYKIQLSSKEARELLQILINPCTIAEEAITPAHRKGRFYELRLDRQSNEWCAKRSSRSVTANITSGGKWCDAEDALYAIFKSRLYLSRRDLRKLAKAEWEHLAELSDKFIAAVDHAANIIAGNSLDKQREEYSHSHVGWDYIPTWDDEIKWYYLESMRCGGSSYLGMSNNARRIKK